MNPTINIEINIITGLAIGYKIFDSIMVDDLRLKITLFFGKYFTNWTIINTQLREVLGTNTIQSFTNIFLENLHNSTERNSTCIEIVYKIYTAISDWPEFVATTWKDTEFLTIHCIIFYKYTLQHLIDQSNVERYKIMQCS